MLANHLKNWRGGSYLKRKVCSTVVLVFIFCLVMGLSLAQAEPAKKKAGADITFTEAVNSSLQEVVNVDRVCSVKRQQLVGSIYEYTLVLKVGDGEFDKIGIHRVVEEKSPWVPIKTKRAVMLLHGDSCNFTNAFMAPTSNQSFGTYLAGQGIDVWGIDLRWNCVPDSTTNFSFMEDWDTALHLKDIKLAVKLARTVRGITGSDNSKIFMLGHSRGAQFLYAYANEESQLSEKSRDLKGIIPVDMIYKLSAGNGDLKQAALVRYQAYKSLYDSGVYYSDEAKNMKIIAYLAQSDPDGLSPVVPGLTNRQAALFVLTSTFATYQEPLKPPTPFYHYLAGTFDENLLPAGLQFAAEDNIINNAFAAPDFQSIGEMIDGEAIISDSIENPYDDHLGDIVVPVYYVGAAGGFGEYGADTLDFLGSTDKESLIVKLYPPEAAALDYGHADLFWANNAKELVWEPICSWIKSH